jgi:hypothetical protein
MDISDLNFKPCICGYQVPILTLRVMQLVLTRLALGLPLLLAPHQGESERALSRLPEGVHG